MNTLYSIYAFIFGCMIGSFLNVVILRLPVKKNLVSDRSACPSCGRQLAWYHNIPILSFLFLKGKCGFCHNRISWRYPLIEILTGLICFWLFPESLEVESLGYFLFLFSIACIFIAHFFIDIDHKLLLDSLNLYLVLIILPYSVFHFHWSYWLIGAALGFGIPLLVTWLFYKLRGQIGMGGGDIKLYGILGFLVGPTGIFFTIFLSCMLGAILGITLILTKKMSSKNTMAFGPLILIVSAFQIFFPEYSRYLQSLFF